ncbi:MAG: SIMPL domain-containing protein [Pseudanabaenaceae cyanobacterium SKYGB_i_bin29]|nr:SIMPL domain-containing protein [Pseudanabaenaceae cyanobacterium SKYG29]MDW8420556.1 SIMPL domain-containing protein [Pseudanabaenaceae cyanobacterium SKYGB_i_bin29]
MEKNPNFPQLFAGMAVLGASVVVASTIAGVAITRLRSQDVLTVIGSAKRPIRSDYVVWRSSVTAQQPTLRSAYQELKSYSDRVLFYLGSQGIPSEAVSLSAVNTETIYETINGVSTGKVQSYRLTQSFTVSSSDVDGITRLVQTSGELISEGVPFSSEAPEYVYTKLSDLRVEMLAAATEDAKRRAEAILKVTGRRPGAIRAAETDVFQITRRFSTEVSNMGSYDTSTIDKDITAVVAITFSVE